MYEKRSDALLSRSAFLARVLGHLGVAVALAAFSLLLGMAGYHYFEGFPATDAFLDSAMLLGGMGPVRAPVTTGGKLFAGCYALYAGLLFIVAAGVVLAPLFHRIVHRFHLEAEDDGDDSPGPTSGAGAGTRRRRGSPGDGSRARRRTSSR